MRRLSLPILIACLAAAPLAAQQPQAFLITLGKDTAAIERFTISPTRIEGTGLVRQPRTTVRRFTIDMADGRPTRLQAAQFAPGVPETGTPLQRATGTITRDSVITETRRDTATTTSRRALPAGPAIPALGGVAGSFLAYELIAERLHAMRGDDSVRFMTTAGPWWAAKLGRDSIWIYDGNNRFHMHVDRDGRILHAVPLSGTQQFAVARIPSADINALATAFGARDTQGQGLGLASPRDTVRASVAGANLLVDYSRPSKRGREIFGTTIVPWGEVWRLGANAATQFRTDKALEMGGVTLPAGFYTLWAVPQQGGWRLLINSQTGQWGTAHDASKDIFALDMPVSRLPALAERFTISVSPNAQGGVFQFDWDTTRATLPFTVR
jgi:hypothetical protein